MAVAALDGDERGVAAPTSPPPPVDPRVGLCTAGPGPPACGTLDGMGFVWVVNRGRRLPMCVHPGWLLLVCLVAGGLAWPFWWLWAPLGWVVGVAVFAALWLLLLGMELSRAGRRRVGAAASASVRVRSPRG